MTRHRGRRTAGGREPTVVLGAAAERDIPSVPRRASLLPGRGSDQDEPGRRGRRRAPTRPADGRRGQGPGDPDDESRYTPGPPSSGRSSAPCWSAGRRAGGGAGLGGRVRLDPHPVLRRGRRRAGRDLPGPAARTSRGCSSPRCTRCRTCRWQSAAVLPGARSTAGIEVASLDAARVTIEQLSERPPLRAATPDPAAPDPTPATSSTSRRHPAHRHPPTTPTRRPVGDDRPPRTP